MKGRQGSSTCFCRCLCLGVSETFGYVDFAIATWAVRLAQKEALEIGHWHGTCWNQLIVKLTTKRSMPYFNHPLIFSFCQLGARGVWLSIF